MPLLNICMKICLINNLYKPYNRGGAEKVTETIANGLIKAGHEVFIITTSPKAELRVTSCELRAYYLKSLYYSLNKLPKFFRPFWHIWNIFNLASYFKIKKILRDEKCGAVITNNLMGIGFLTPRAIKKLGIKHLHIAHDIQLIHPSGLIYYGREGIVDGLFAKTYAAICRYLFASPEAVIFPSNWLKNFYINRKFFANSKIDVLANPVDAAPVQTVEHKDSIKFLFIGQVEKHKGIFLLIDAFNRIKNSEAELLIVGDGSQMEKAKNQTKNNKNINFLGWPGDEKADILLSTADCLVYPSLVYENCPNAIQRALAAGLQVVASDLGGIPELLKDGAGILFKPADAADLAEKIKGIIKEGNNYNVPAQPRFKTEEYIKKIINLTD